MKKFSLLLVCGILLATLAGCGGDAGDAGASATATTGTTTTGTAVSTTESTTAAETAATTEQTADDTTTDIATTTGAATTTTKATTQATTKATTRTTTKAAATTKSSPAYKSYTEGRISFKLPSHFAKIMEEPVLFVSEDYPQIGDNFALIVTDKDPEFNNFTKEDYTAQLETVFSGLVVSESTLTITIHQTNDPLKPKQVVSWSTLSWNDMGTWIKNGFTTVINVLIAVFQWLVIVIASASPLLLLAGIVVVVILLIRRRKRQNQPNTPQPPQTPQPPTHTQHLG